MRFTAGLIVGILIGRPVLSLVNDHLTPPIRRKITNGVNSLAEYLNNQIQGEEE